MTAVSRKRGRDFALNVTELSDAVNSGSLKELGVMLIVAVVLLALVNRVPALIGGLAMGGGTHALGHGFGAGAAMGTAAMASAAVATGGAAIMAGAASAAGGAQALMAATSKASQNVAGGTDIVSRIAGGMADAVSGGGSGGSAGSIRSPLAGAMDGPAIGSSPSFGATSDGSHPNSSGKSSSAKGSASGNAKVKGEGTTPGQQPQDGTKSVLGTAGKVAVDTATNLAKGSWDVAREKAQTGAGVAQERIGQTIGGKIAAAITAQGTTTASTEQARPERYSTATVCQEPATRQWTPSRKSPHSAAPYLKALWVNLRVVV